MKRTLSRRIRLCALLIATLQFAMAQEVERGTKVTEIRIRHIGPASVSDDLVRANIRVKTGDAYSPASIDSDIQNLYSTGFFYNVRVGYEVSPAGVALTYGVQGKPVLTEVRFSGNKKYSTSRLRRKLTSKVGEPIDELKLFNDAQEILKMYQKAGLHKTKVDPKPVITEELGKGIVTFEVTESPKVKIEDVVFEDASAFTQRKLRRQIKTRRKWMFSWLTGSGKFKDEQFEEDKEKLRDFYVNKGYVDYDLKDVKQEYSKTNRMVLKLQVSEGTQYKVGSVEFKGNEIYTKEEIRKNSQTLELRRGEKSIKGLKLKEGAVFSPKDLDRDVEAIRDLYGAAGYIDARVGPQKNANIEKGTMDVIHNIDEGEKSYVERVDIKGNWKTKDRVIRRELAISPGESFDTVRVKISKSKLEQMQFFEKVETTDEPTDVANRRNLVIAVEEKNTGNIAVGAGFSSVDNVVGFVEVSQGNFDLFHPPTFTGGGQKARLRAQFGARRQDYVLTFVEPWFLGKRLSFSTELYHRQLNFLSDNFEQTQTGAKFGFTKQLPHNFIASINYTIERIDINFSDFYQSQYPKEVPITITDPSGTIITNGVQPNPNRPLLLNEEGERLVSRVGGSLAHDTRNSALLPTKGHRVEASSDLAGGPFGGDVDYYRLELRAAQYFNPLTYFKMEGNWEEFFSGHILELAGRVGVIEAYGDGDRGQDRVPLFDRYFLGGLYSLRGYRFRQIGPRDPFSDEPIGGNTYWFGSAEYSIPIIERLRLAFFYDIGMVYEDSYSFDPQTLANGDTTRLYNDNWGVGIRLNLPIGPLRLDYGIPMTHDTRIGGSGRFQFGVGYSREF